MEKLIQACTENGKEDSEEPNAERIARSGWIIRIIDDCSHIRIRTVVDEHVLLNLDLVENLSEMLFRTCSILFIFQNLSGSVDDIGREVRIQLI